MRQPGGKHWHSPGPDSGTVRGPWAGHSQVWPVTDPPEGENQQLLVLAEVATYMDPLPAQMAM